VQIGTTSLLVDNQEKALQFYTELLGFNKKTDLMIGSDYRWLTVTASTAAGEVELLLQPMMFPEAKAYQETLYRVGSPFIAFRTANIQDDYERLKAAGVIFRMEPTKMEQGMVSSFFEDGCGNIIHLYQL